MVRRHHQINGHEFEQAPGDSERQGSLACCSLWGHKRVRHDSETKQQHQFLAVTLDTVQFSSVAQLCPARCDPMNRSTPGLPVHHQLPEFTQTHVH